MKKVICTIVLVPLAVALFYGFMHIAHAKCVKAALEAYCERNAKTFQKIESLEVPWWQPFTGDEYSCVAKIVFEKGSREISFVAKEATLSDFDKDDWDVNLGFWGLVLHEDYRIVNVR